MLPDDPDAQARIFYLSLLGIFVAAGLFHQYRRRLGAAAQHAAIWGLIFVGATMAAAFWEPLMNQIVPGRAATQADGTVVLRRASDGHFHANAEVNGTAIRFIVDTGASAIVLSRSDALAAGIDLESLAFTIPVRTANGRVRAAGVRLESLAFGGATDRGIPAMVNGGSSTQSLLGMEYLDRFRSLKIEGDLMILER